MSKRCNGEGSIFKERSGYRVVVTKLVDGKPVRRTKLAKTRADAAAKLNELRGGSFVAKDKHTIKTFLAVWMADTVKPNCELTTYDSYERSIRNHIVPYLGGLRLREIEKQHVLDWLVELEDDEAGSRTRQLAFVVLAAAMKDAASRKGCLQIDPTISVKKPSHESAEMFPFEIAEMRRIIAHTEGDRSHALIRLGFTGGLRQCELFGLHKDRILWKSNRIKVDLVAACTGGKIFLKKPKTKSSNRFVDVPPSTMAALRRHLAMMEKEGFGDLPLVFPNSVGSIIGRGGFRKWVWRPLLDELGIEQRGFHNTRHTYASIALGDGIPVTIVQKQLGHAKPSTTYDIYAHVLEAQKAASDIRLNQIFG